MAQNALLTLLCSVALLGCVAQVEDGGEVIETKEKAFVLNEAFLLPAAPVIWWQTYADIQLVGSTLRLYDYSATESLAVEGATQVGPGVGAAIWKSPSKSAEVERTAPSSETADLPIHGTIVNVWDAPDHPWFARSENDVVVLSFPETATDVEVADVLSAMQRWMVARERPAIWLVDLSKIKSAPATQRRVTVCPRAGCAGAHEPA